MSGILESIEAALKNSASYLPLEWSAFLGGMIEEIIAPIPSPFVMAAVGSAAYAQSKMFPALVWYAFMGSVGKTIGAWVIYAIADKLEDAIVPKFGRFFGISHQEVEGLGKKFNGGWRDDLILFTLRALPIVPSSPVSAVCGIIKINLRTYMIATLLGNFVRNFIYIYLGYVGLSAYHSVLSGLDNLESVVQIVIFTALAAFVGWIYYQRHQRSKK